METFKILTVGESGVGKSSLMLWYSENKFDPDILSTVALDFHVKRKSIHGKNTSIQMWSMAGQERFRSVMPLFFRASHAAIIVFDLTNPLSFQKLDYWIQEIKNHAPEGTFLMILGNKLDMNSKKILPEDVEHFLRKRDISIPYFEVSAKTGENMDLAMDTLIGKILGQKMNTETTHHTKKLVSPKRKRKCLYC